MKKGKKIIPGYPKKDGDRLIFVRTAVQVTAAMKGKWPYDIEPGKWVAVDVLADGYRHLLSPCEHDTEVTCLAACASSNRLHSFTEEYVNEIISKSMGLIPA